MIREDFQKLGEMLNECVNEKLIIRIGRYEGDYYTGNNIFKRITGELFVMTNSHNIFRVVSDDSSIIDDFDIIGYDSIITPINKKKENGKIDIRNLNVKNKEDLRAYFPNDEIGQEMFECTQSVPIRFRKDVIDTFCDPEDRTMWNYNSVNETWSYLLMDIINEMTDKEKEIYGF